MRAAAVWHEVVGEPETAGARNWCDYALRGRRELCVHDGALRVGSPSERRWNGQAANSTFRSIRRMKPQWKTQLSLTTGGSDEIRSAIRLLQVPLRR